MKSNGPAYVHISSKGQVVIPASLRLKFHVEKGTRAVIESRPDGILIKPITRHAVDAGFGILKRKGRCKSLAEEWAEYKREERELEERKLARHGL